MGAYAGRAAEGREALQCLQHCGAHTAPQTMNAAVIYSYVCWLLILPRPMSIGPRRNPHGLSRVNGSSQVEAKDGSSTCPIALSRSSMGYCHVSGGLDDATAHGLATRETLPTVIAIFIAGCELKVKAQASS